MLYSSTEMVNECRYAKEILYKRIRIPVTSTYRKVDMCEKITNHVFLLKGVVQCTANPITGKILVVYDEELVCEKQIEQHINIFDKKCQISKQGNLISLNTTKNDLEVSLPLAFEDVDTILAEDEEKLWHYKDYRATEAAFGTNIISGLNYQTIIERSKEYGLNVLSEKKKKSLFAKFLENLGDFSTKLLIAVGAISFIIGQIPDAIAILAIVLLETTLSTAQQSKAENSIYSLKDMLVHKAMVIRDGCEKEIDAKYIVPGDIIMLEAGDKVPADARIFECNDLKTSESSLTGESVPILKSKNACPKYATLGDKNNMLFMGTNILSGRGKAIVVATGMNTEIGKIATLLHNINSEPTPLQRRMHSFTNKLTKACLSLCLVSGVVGLLAGRTIGQVLTMAISFSVGVMPESLPAVVTIAMAVSVQRMAKRKAIIRKLPSVETLGSANVICCDKTGTLTMNEMTVRKVYVDNSTYIVSGTGYEPKGEVILSEGSLASRKALEELLKYSVSCNNAALLKEKGNRWIVKGDPTEGALITAAKKVNLNEEYIRKDYLRLHEIPFDSARRYMTVVVDTPEGKIVICKGSLSSVLKNCKTLFEDGEEKLLTSSHRERLNKVCEEMAEKALRVLAFSYKKIGNNSADKNIENNHVFFGMVGMEDPPRKDVKKSIQKCHSAGIKVVMITGDNKNTAVAIGKSLGILTDGLVLSGSELENMNEDELDLKIKKVQIFARTSPEQKLRIVGAFKRLGYVVAMTGDGVNDAPAIKEANIGIAMGRNGSDVAKDVASITLLDDNFATIVNAIEEGRVVSKNIKNSVKYLLSGSFGEMVAILLTSAICGSLPLLSIQILWVNVICETMLGAPLAVEPAGEDIMNTPPERKDAPIIDRELGKQVLKRGLGIGLTTFAAFEIPLMLGMGVNKARTLALTNLIFTQIVNCYDCRSSKRLRPSNYMSLALLSSVALIAGILYIPFMSAFLGTVPLKIMDWCFVSGLTLLSRI